MLTSAAPAPWRPSHAAAGRQCFPRNLSEDSEILAGAYDHRCGKCNEGVARARTVMNGVSRGVKQTLSFPKPLVSSLSSWSPLKRESVLSVVYVVSLPARSTMLRTERVSVAPWGPTRSVRSMQNWKMVWDRDAFACSLLASTCRCLSPSSFCLRTWSKMWACACACVERWCTRFARSQQASGGYNALGTPPRFYTKKSMKSEPGFFDISVMREAKNKHHVFASQCKKHQKIFHCLCRANWCDEASPRSSPPCVTFRLVVAPLRGPGQSPVLPFACCVGSLLSVGRCGQCSCWCCCRVCGAQ